MSVEDDITALKEATRVAHETIKDLRVAIREGAQQLGLMRLQLKQDADAQISQAVKAGLENFDNSIEKSIESATEAVDKIFQVIADILLGEDAKSKRLHQPSLSDYAARIVERKGKVI